MPKYAITPERARFLMISMYNDYVGDKRLSRNDTLVMNRLTHIMDDRGFIGEAQQSIADYLEVNREVVSRSIRQLVAMGYARWEPYKGYKRKLRVLPSAVSRKYSQYFGMDHQEVI